MYTLFPNIHTQAVCALENGQGISIGKTLNCHIMVKKWGEKMKISNKNEKNEVP